MALSASLACEFNRTGSPIPKTAFPDNAGYQEP
jgi:hypothetical protein